MKLAKILTGPVLALTALALPLPSISQSRINIYGIVDAGITRVNNIAGTGQTLTDTGVMQASRLGFRGTEDLGAGMSAVFVLEQGLLIDSGSLGQGGLAFGRQSWVGLSDLQLGTLTVGRQYDFMFDSLAPYINSTMSGGAYANNPLDNDRASGQRVNNSIKYVTPKINGFSAGALVALSEANGSVRGPNFSRSFGANYTQDAFSLGAAYTYLQGGTLPAQTLLGTDAPSLLGGASNQTIGIGGSYRLSPLITIHSMLSRSKFEGPVPTANASFHNVSGGLVYRPSTPWKFGAAFNRSKVNSNEYLQVNLTADYIFSKRTDIYTQFVRQVADGVNARANIFTLGGSASSGQTAVRVGIRHLF